MLSILLLSICYNCPNPTYAFFGFILMIIIITLVIRKKLRKPKQSTVIENINEEFESLYIEKDVLGLDKTYTNYNEPTYKIADKSKFKLIIFTILFLLGLFLAIVFTPKKYGSYQEDETITIQELQNWDQPDEFNESH
jgi:uncharacterized membrane protein